MLHLTRGFNQTSSVVGVSARRSVLGKTVVGSKSTLQLLNSFHISSTAAIPVKAPSSTSAQPPVAGSTTASATTAATPTSRHQAVNPDPFEQSKATTAAWCFSPVNSGNPYLYDFTPPAPLPPVPTPTETTSDFPTAVDLESTYTWTTSPVNTGNPVSESFLSICAGFPPNASPYTFLTSETNPEHLMASDADYQAFLDKAGADAQGSGVKTQQYSSGGQQLTTASVPAALGKVQATFVSDADEPFEPVSMEHGVSGGKASAEDVAHLAGVKKGDVTHVGAWKEFDPKGHYGEVKDAVEKEAKNMSVWKIEKSGARCEYWILGIAKEDEGKVVGFRAKAVES